ncbi:MAG: hypothetical protein HY821_03215 [Acidobacteria bacterium]|nr:hypothetical protein [Acidobacteriota bacterium]
MLPRWAQLVFSFLLCLTLVGAPCRNCQPKEQAKHCGHDCCPKPKPVKQSCSWQPADYDAVEKAKDLHAGEPLAVAVQIAAPETLVPVISAERPAPVVDTSPPPVYLANASFRI